MVQFLIICQDHIIKRSECCTEEGESRGHEIFFILNPLPPQENLSSKTKKGQWKGVGGASKVLIVFEILSFEMLSF